MCADHTRDSASALERYEEMDQAINAIDVSINPNTSEKQSTRIPAPRSSRNKFRRANNSHEHAEHTQYNNEDSYESFLHLNAIPTDNKSHINSDWHSDFDESEFEYSSSNVNNSAIEPEDPPVTPLISVATTSSAPALISESIDNEKKRKRSENSSNQLAPPTKSNNFVKQNVSFSFAQQDRRPSEHVPLTVATSTSHADTRQGELHDMGSGPSDKPQRTPINPLAEPMWLATRKHLISKIKATLRYQHLKELLDDDVMPVEFFGGDLMHRYYASAQGVLSVPMQTLIGRHAREKAELVLTELLATAASEGKKVDYYTSITSQIYVHEEDTTFSDAEAALTRVVSFYEKTEKERLNTQAIKERGRQPLNEIEWTNLVCHPEVRPQTPSTARSTSRGRKRNRSRSKETRAKTSRTDTPGTSAVASGSTAQLPVDPQPKPQQQASVQQRTLNNRPPNPSTFHQERKQDNNRRGNNTFDTPPTRGNHSGSNYRGRGRGHGQNQRGQHQNRGSNRPYYDAPQRENQQQAGNSRARDNNSSDDLLAALTALTRKFNK